MSVKSLLPIVVGTVLGAVLFNHISQIAAKRVPALAPVLNGTLLAGD